MLSREQLQTMLALQFDLNAKIIPDFLERKLPFFRASWFELAELGGHLAWPWWKKQDINVAQAQLELVDVAHFILSEMQVQAYTEVLVSNRELIVASALEVAVHDLGLVPSVTLQKSTPIELLEELVRCILNRRADGVHHCSSLVIFQVLCNTLDLTGDQLFLQYICKNALNTFRADHGYKAGKYPKMLWGPLGNEEDNVFLASVIEEQREALLADPESVFEKIMIELEHNYPGDLTDANS